MEALRRAGRALLDFDRAYAGKIAEGTKARPQDDAFAYMTRAVPVEEFYRYPVEGSGPVEKALAEGMRTSAAVGNLAARYALPAGGVTLAGAALVELAEAIGQQTSSTIAP